MGQIHRGGFCFERMVFFYFAVRRGRRTLRIKRDAEGVVPYISLRDVVNTVPYNEIVCMGGFPCPPALEYDYLFTLFRLLTHTEKILAAWMRPLSSIS